MDSLPYTVVGGGICGVLTALKLKQKYADQDILLLEKEPYLGHHATTRNSGVLHAGLYYKTGSLKHRLCLEGYEMWLKIAQQHEIPYDICGKFVIATQEDEIPALEKVYQNAMQNGVTGLRRLTPQDREEIAAYTYVREGFYSPRTGILDVSSAIKILENELQRLGVIIMKNTELVSCQVQSGTLTLSRSPAPERAPTAGFLLQTQDGTIFHTQHLINCAGAWAVELRKQLGLTDVKNQFVKGNYLRLKKPYYNKKLIYPVPAPNLAGLGVHTSFHIDRLIRFGPNTENVDHVDYMNHNRNLDLMLAAIQSKFKGIARGDLTLDYCGVRTKIWRGGELHPDFLIQLPSQTGIPGYAEALGIESPGLTAAPAIACRLSEWSQT